MSDANAYISNGTCYTSKGDQLDGSFIPCGNDAFGHQTCCGAGDNCLADNACFGIHGSGYGSYLTYWAGCTDPDYADGTCPKKEIDQPWVALTLCDNSDGEWAICSQDGNPSTLQPGAYCSCTNAASATVAFSDSNTLTSICSLPRSTGQSIQFFAGQSPSSSLVAPASTTPSQQSASTSRSATSTRSSTSNSSSSSRSSTNSISNTSSSSSTETASSFRGTTSASSSSSTSTTVTSISTSDTTSSTVTSSAESSSSNPITVLTSNGSTVTSTAAPQTTSPAAGAGGVNSSNASSGGLSSGAKIGIGVGAGLGALILLAAILAFFLLRRRRRRKTQPPRHYSPPTKLETDGIGVTPYEQTRPATAPIMSTAPRIYDAKGQRIPEADGQAAAWPWATRSELPGSPVRLKKEQRVPVGELAGTENFVGEQGVGHSLAGEASRQIGPAWNQGNSLRVLNTGDGRDLGIYTRF